MCQMCAEYEADLRRMGLVEEANKVRAERHAERRQVEPQEVDDQLGPNDLAESPQKVAVP